MTPHLRIYSAPEASPPRTTTDGNAVRLPRPKPAYNDGITVIEVVDHWRRTEQDKYVPRTFVDRDRQLRWFCDEFGDCLVADLVAGDVVDWVKTRPGWKSAETKKVAFQGINHVFNLAKKRKLIRDNPLSDMAEEFEEGEPRRAVRRSELLTMMRASSDRLFCHFLLFLWFSGVRPGEAADLRWSEVDFERKCLVIEQHKTRKKTKKPRIVPLMKSACRLLRRLARQKLSEELVFVNRTGTAWNAQSLGNRMAVFRENAVIEDDCVLHGIRHAWATLMIAAGVKIKIVSQVLGHKSVRTTERRYCHLEEEVDAIIEALEDGRAKLRARLNSHRNGV